MPAPQSLISIPQRLRLVFMGTPEFAVPTLRMLLEGKDLVVGVVTQPDQPAGRGMTLHAPPVKVLAEAHQIPVLQPKTLRTPEALDPVRAWRPDLILVIAYGRMLPNALLTLPPLGCINVHASLLPKYRGAAPIQWAIARGEQETGVTIMCISERMDAGDILLQKSIPIEKHDTGGSLHDKLARVGAEALREALTLLKQGQLIAQPQNEAEATYAPIIKKEDGRIDWSQSAIVIEQRIRAFTPWPSVYTTFWGKLLKISRAQPEPQTPRSTAPPGTVTEVSPVHLLIATGEGQLSLLEVQLEGKKRMAIEEFLRGHVIQRGAVLGA